MLGKAFAIICIGSFVIAILTGNIEATARAALEGAGRAVSLTMLLVGMLALWNGIMRVLIEVGAIRVLSRLMSPLLRFIFPEAHRQGRAMEEISASIVANVMGMGNAATPLAMSAMLALSEDLLEKDRASDDMIMFTVMNTAPLNLLPMTIIALRQAAGSANPFAVIFPIWIVSGAGMIVAILICKLFRAIWREKRRAA